MHLGVILPNYGTGSSPDGIRRVAEAAEELGFDSVWATEHIIVGPEAVDPYSRVYDPLVTLGWIAGWTDRIGLGTFGDRFWGQVLGTGHGVARVDQGASK